jgi:putative FmdB family regulatory protein
MPRYCFVCSKCGIKIEVIRPMVESNDPWSCVCGNRNMRRNFQAEDFFASGDYKRPVHSDSLAISPTQVAEHQKLFPDIKLDEQCRPVLDNFQKHEAYLKQTGFIKHPGKRKRKGKII